MNGSRKRMIDRQNLSSIWHVRQFDGSLPFSSFFHQDWLNPASSSALLFSRFNIRNAQVSISVPRPKEEIHGRELAVTHRPHR